MNFRCGRVNVTASGPTRFQPWSSPKAPDTRIDGRRAGAWPAETRASAPAPEQPDQPEEGK